MQTVRWWRGAAVAAGLLALTLGGAARGAEDKPNKDLDKAIYNSLANVVNKGAAAYNVGDHMGCYRMFEGALLTVHPLLAHRRTLQDAITKGMAAAAANPVLIGKTGRAWALHTLLEHVRKEIRPGGTGKPPVVDKPKTLWDRLGGEKGVKKIVDDLVAKAAADKKVNFDRNGKYKLTPEVTAHVKKAIVNWISSVSEGPYTYDKTMKQVHKGMGITNAEYTAFSKDVEEVLTANDVKLDDVATIMNRVEEYRKAIVAPKPKPADTKPADTKPKDTKPKDTKPVTTKPADTKPKDTKSVDTK